jgi:hypothetical protein
LPSRRAAAAHFRHGDDQSASAKKTPLADQTVSLHNGKLAMLTPTSAPAQEEDRQTLAVLFTDTLGKLRPDLTAAPLATTLSDINAAGLAGPYAQMYAGYKTTGLFDTQTLRQVAQAAGARYLIQLKLGTFERGSAGGFSVLGTSLGQKQTADLHLTLQIWDAGDGKLVWERSTEQSDSKRSLILARTIKLEDVEKSAAEDLIKQLPH